MVALKLLLVVLELKIIELVMMVIEIALLEQVKEVLVVFKLVVISGITVVFEFVALELKFLNVNSIMEKIKIHTWKFELKDETSADLFTQKKKFLEIKGDV